MAQKIQIRRGLKGDLPTLSIGEFAFCTDTKELFIGSSEGNFLIGSLGTDATPPNNATNLQVNNITDTTLTLSWNASTSSDVSSYEIYQGDTLLGTITNTFYNVTNLSGSISYTFLVKSKDNSGNVSNGVTINATTANPIDITAPNPVTNLNVGNVDSGSISISWELSTSNDVLNYEIAYSSNGGNYIITSSTVNSNSNSYIVKGLTTNTLYSIRIVAIDTVGNRSNPTTISATTNIAIDTNPPQDVSGLQANNIGANSLTLTWSASISNDISSYDVYDGSTILGNTTSTSYIVNGLTPASSHRFTIKAKDTSGNISTGTYVDTVTLSIVSVTGVSLDKAMSSIDQNTTLKLNATVTPNNAINKNLIWTSSNESIATVDNTGLVTGVEVGTSTITVTTEDGNYTAVCSITIAQIIAGFDYNNIMAYPDDSTVTFDQHVTSGGTIGDGSFVHPSVLYFADDWNGHKWWMGINPYPGTNGTYEDPFFFYSDDGNTWLSPYGGVQPIYPLNSLTYGNNSDAHIFMDYDGVTMHYLNRAVYKVLPSPSTSSAASSIECYSTTDGINWTARKTIIDTINTGYDIVAPSVCKANGKYYLFAQDPANLNEMVIMEATTVYGTWTEINRISTGVLGALWHAEVRYINQEFIVLASNGQTNGGNLMLGKFSDVMDATVIGRNNVFIPALKTQSYNQNIYKSSFVVKGANDYEVFIGFKGGGLSSTTEWRITRVAVHISPQTLDLSGAGYTQVATYTDISALQKTDYYRCAIDMTISSLDFKPRAFADSTNQNAKIYIDANNILTAEAWGINGGTVTKQLSYGISINDRLTMMLDDDLEFYINGRSIYKIVGVGSKFDKYGLEMQAMIGSLTDVKVYKLPKYMYSVASAQTYKDNTKSDALSNPNNYIIVDEFNRPDGGVGTSDNGKVWDIINYPIITSNHLKPGDKGAVFTPCEGNFQVLLNNSSTGNIIFGLYLKYTDANNYIKFLVVDGASLPKTRRLEVKENGAISNYDYLSYGDDYHNHYNWRLDVIDGYIHLYEDNLLTQQILMPNKSFGNNVGLASQYASGQVDYIIVKQLDSVTPVLYITPSINFTGTQTVAMSTTGIGTIIYYTADGSDPTSSGTRLQYESPITVSNTTTVKAYAVSSDGTQSSITKVATYTKVVSTVIVLDDFNRIDTTSSSTGLGTTVVGNKTWTTTPSTSSTASAQVLTNEAKLTATGEFIIDSGYSDGELSVKLSTASSVSYTNILARYIDDNNLFLIRFYSGWIELQARVNGSYTNGQGNSSPTSLGWALAKVANTQIDGQVVKVQMDKTNIKVLVNDVVKININTSYNMTGTKFGISGVANSRYDDFKFTSNI